MSGSFRYHGPEDHVVAVAPLSVSDTLVFDEIEALLGLDEQTPPPVREGVAAARRRGELLAASLIDGGSDSAELVGGIVYAAEALAATWLDRRWNERVVDRFLNRLAAALGTSPGIARASVFSQAVRERHVLELPPQLGAETILQMLHTFTDMIFASLWTQTEEDRLVEMVRAGESDSSRRTRAVARETIAAGLPVTTERSYLHALPVQRWGEPAAALVFRCRPEERLRALAFAAEAASALIPVIEFDTLLGRNAQREQLLTQSSERQLTRLGFDLHDGPMQDIAALASDVRLFRTQLAPLLEGHPRAEVALGRIDDLEARLVGLDGELRQLAGSLQSPAGLRLSLSEAVEHEVAEFRRRSRITATFSRSGAFDALTASQKIALLRIVQEALNNADEHSGARTVSVRVSATRTRLHVEIEDDGTGFDVEQELLRAARAGRLGVVGMGERIRLLGGRFAIESRPGGPTRVTATVPRWSPLTGKPDGAS
jgi:signal transduction histidine kinase